MQIKPESVAVTSSHTMAEIDYVITVTQKFASTFAQNYKPPVLPWLPEAACGSITVMRRVSLVILSVILTASGSWNSCRYLHAESSTNYSKDRRSSTTLN